MKSCFGSFYSTQHFPTGDASALLQETLEAYYWAGFITADGHVSGSTLTVTLSTKDANHLKKLAKFLNTEYRYKHSIKQIQLRCTDSVCVPEFAKKFDLKPNKTYAPPTNAHFTDEQFLAYWAGYTDGDGHFFRARNTLRIECHESWFNVLDAFVDRLHSIFDKPRKGVARIYYRPLRLYKYGHRCASSTVIVRICRTDLLESWRRVLTDKGVPILSRKWNRIRAGTENGSAFDTPTERPNYERSAIVSSLKEQIRSD